jgi:hypothetical protein
MGSFINKLIRDQRVISKVRLKYGQFWSMALQAFENPFLLFTKKDLVREDLVREDVKAKRGLAIGSH